MSDDPGKKTCKLCCLEIPKDARKCGHCQHFQNRLAVLVYHPAVAILFACLPMVILMLAFGNMFDQGEDYQSYEDQIEITESEMVFADTKSGATVAVLGIINNKSPVSWKNIEFHADFFDARGQRTDVGHRQEHQFFLPANGTSSFKVSFRRDFPETNYVKHKVQVANAKDTTARW